jgi:hypothetical protein
MTTQEEKEVAASNGMTVWGPVAKSFAVHKVDQRVLSYLNFFFQNSGYKFFLAQKGCRFE